MKKPKVYYMAMTCSKPKINLIPPVEIQLPERCVGISYIFETKGAARKWSGKNVELVKVVSLNKEKADEKAKD